MKALCKPYIRELSTEASERSCDDARDEQHRQVITDGGGAHDGDGDRQLAQVMSHGGEDADHPHLLRRKPSAEQGADTEGQQAIICPVAIQPKVTRTSTMHRVGPGPRAYMAKTVTTLARPSLMPGMAVKEGSCASAVKMHRAMAVNRAVRVSFRVFMIPPPSLRPRRPLGCPGIG